MRMTVDHAGSPATIATVPSDKQIKLDSLLMRRTLLLALLLCWPLLLFGRPAYYPDTDPYYKGGKVAVAFVADKLFPPPPAPPDPAAAAAPGNDRPAATVPGANVRGARSIPYSITAYVLSGPQHAMIPLVVFDALLAAFAIAVFLTALDLGTLAWWGASLLLAFATPAALVSCFAMPDIFAGITILTIAVLTVVPGRLTTPVAIMLALVDAFAIASHTSHVALALALLPIALLWRWRNRLVIGRRASLWIAAPVLLGIAIVVISGIVAFREVSLAPQRFPLALARAIDDGPARWYLARHCRDRHFAVCELYPDGVLPSGFEFVWGLNGIHMRASADQLKRIRDQEFEILLRAAVAYPWQQASQLSWDVGRQLVAFDLDELNFNARAQTRPDGSLQFVPIPGLPEETFAWADWIVRSSAAIAAIALAIGLFKARGERRMLAVLLLTGLIANAAICAIFAEWDDRYQVRVIWLLPLAAIAVWAPRRQYGIVSFD